jgi:hypothetical protein
MVWLKPHQTKAQAKQANVDYCMGESYYAAPSNHMRKILADLNYPLDVQHDFDGWYVKAPCNSIQSAKAEVARFQSQTHCRPARTL